MLGLAKAGQGWAGGGKGWGDMSGFERERGRKFWGPAERSENGGCVGKRGCVRLWGNISFCCGCVGGCDHSFDIGGCS